MDDHGRNQQDVRPCGAVARGRETEVLSAGDRPCNGCGRGRFTSGEIRQDTCAAVFLYEADIERVFAGMRKSDTRRAALRREKGQRGELLLRSQF